MFKKVFVYCLLAWGAFVIWQLAFSRDLFPSNGIKIPIQLTHGPLTVFAFPSKQKETFAVILFGSGDGGWSTFEEAIGHACQNRGYEMIGIDSQAYAQTDYNLETLQSDFRSIAENVLAPFGKEKPPLIIGGYSMGAAQAVAAAGGPHPPPNVVGLILVDALSRGRYGLHRADQMNVLPIGPGTFGVADFSGALARLRIVQWHAEQDSIDSRAWLDSLPAEHRELDFPGTGHTYDENRDDFIRQFVASIDWILNPKENAPERQEATLSHE